MERVHLVSLGCPKNRVDSEVMVGQLQSGPFELVNDPADADVIVVNTCSFIQPATEESIDTVLEMAKYKRDGSCKKLVVTGCMVQRYGDSLEGELPEVDHFLGTGEYHRISEVLLARDGKQPKADSGSHPEPPSAHDQCDRRLYQRVCENAECECARGYCGRRSA